MNRIERFTGSLLGLAVGDALGAPLEFRSPGSFTPVVGMTDGGPWDLKAGYWTDDTSMALCLAESLVERNGFDASDQMGRYLNWYRHGYMSSTGVCFDIGNATRRALERFERTNEPLAGATDPGTAGNGSIMRLAPVPLFYAADWQEAVRKSAGSSRTTHGAATAVDACRYFGGLVAGAANGVSKETLLGEYYSPVDGYWKRHPLCTEIDEIARGSFRERQPPEITGSGYVVRSLEAALWALYNSHTFEEGCLLAVNLGDDADTTGAVYGQLAGAIYGEGSVPAEWLNTLTQVTLIRQLAERLAHAAEQRRG